MINNEQNTIIKIFSVLAVALMPPTLVGTVYGMNFKHIPELEWMWGYPFALLDDGHLGRAAVVLFQAQGLALIATTASPKWPWLSRPVRAMCWRVSLGEGRCRSALQQALPTS